MKSLIKSIALGIISAFAVLGININSSGASLQSSEVKIKENTPLYLEHASTIQQDQEKNNLLAWHYSHASHASHASHESHYSHYSSRY